MILSRVYICGFADVNEGYFLYSCILMLSSSVNVKYDFQLLYAV